MKPLTAKQVAERLGYCTDTIYSYARTGRLPAPIDPTLPTRVWRWSPAVIDAYVAGEWQTPRPTQIRRAS